jgi:hypothetical protein
MEVACAHAHQVLGFGGKDYSGARNDILLCVEVVDDDLKLSNTFSYLS